MSEWQLDQGMGEPKVTWPAGLFLHSRSWVLRDSLEWEQEVTQVVPLDPV